jgi:hypothetical protein
MWIEQKKIKGKMMKERSRCRKEIEKYLEFGYSLEEVAVVHKAGKGCPRQQNDINRDWRYSHNFNLWSCVFDDDCPQIQKMMIEQNKLSKDERQNNEKTQTHRNT